MSAVTVPPPSVYPMRVVTRLTGLSSHTIRVWESRHAAVSPTRTEGNARRYSEEDVRRLRLLRELTEAGHRISEVAGLPDPELARLARGDQGTDSFDELRQAYLTAIEGFRGREASGLLSRAAAVLEPSSLALDVILPILRETGRRWGEGQLNVAHEHLVSVHMRSLLDALMRQTEPLPGAPVLVAATPAGHRHEFGALVGAQLAAARGYEVLYLGADVPQSDLLEALGASAASLCLLAINRSLDAPEQSRIEQTLAEVVRVCEVWMGLPPGHVLAQRPIEGVRYVTDLQALDHALVQRVTG